MVAAVESRRPKNAHPRTARVTSGYRFYSPALGRWTARDPIGERGGLNLYGFVANNAVLSFDAWGLLSAFPTPWDPEPPVYPPWGPKPPEVPTYVVDKCTIVLFYGHGKISFFKGVKVKKCAGTTAVTCQSKTIFTHLDGVIPGAVGTDKDVDSGLITQEGCVDAGTLYPPNVAAMKAHAETLRKPPCCCKKVKLLRYCVGSFWQCNSGPWSLWIGWFSPPAGLPTTVP